MFIHRRCIVLTINEIKVVKYLLAHFSSESSINMVAKECHLSPNGAYKILKKLEKENILIHKKIANVKSFSLNFESEKTALVLQLALIMDAQRAPKVATAADISILYNSKIISYTTQELEEKIPAPKLISQSA